MRYCQVIKKRQLDNYDQLFIDTTIALSIYRQSRIENTLSLFKASETINHLNKARELSKAFLAVDESKSKNRIEELLSYFKNLNPKKMKRIH